MKNRYSIESSTAAYSVVEKYCTCSSDTIRVVGTYDNLNVACEVAQKSFAQAKETFERDFNSDEFIVSDTNDKIYSKDKLYCYEIEIMPNLFFSTKK